MIIILLNNIVNYNLNILVYNIYNKIDEYQKPNKNRTKFVELLLPRPTNVKRLETV